MCAKIPNVNVIDFFHYGPIQIHSHNLHTYTQRPKTLIPDALKKSLRFLAANRDARVACAVAPVDGTEQDARKGKGGADNPAPEAADALFHGVPFAIGDSCHRCACGIKTSRTSTRCPIADLPNGGVVASLWQLAQTNLSTEAAKRFGVNFIQKPPSSPQKKKRFPETFLKRRANLTVFAQFQPPRKPPRPV